MGFVKQNNLEKIRDTLFPPDVPKPPPKPSDRESSLWVRLLEDDYKRRYPEWVEWKPRDDLNTADDVVISSTVWPYKPINPSDGEPTTMEWTWKIGEKERVNG